MTGPMVQVSRVLAELDARDRQALQEALAWSMAMDVVTASNVAGVRSVVARHLPVSFSRGGLAL